MDKEAYSLINSPIRLSLIFCPYEAWVDYSRY